MTSERNAALDFYSKNVYDIPGNWFYYNFHSIFIYCKKCDHSFCFLLFFSFVTIFWTHQFFYYVHHSIVMFRNYVKPCHNPWEMRPVFFTIFFHGCLSGLSKTLFRRWGLVVVKASSTWIFLGCEFFSWPLMDLLLSGSRQLRVFH